MDIIASAYSRAMAEEQNAEQEEAIPGRLELRSVPGKVWYMPDNSRFTDPLPPVHHRGTIAAIIVLIIGFLLPSDNMPDALVVTHEAQLDTRSQSQPPTEEQLWAQLATPQNNPDQVAPVTPEPVREGQPEEQPQTTHTQPSQPDSGIDNQRCSHHVEPGKTMAQLFRDHGLPATDAYAMTQAKGANKPLNNL